MIKICFQCEIEFKGTKNQKFCSTRCRGNHWWQGKYKAKLIDHICEYCNKNFISKYNKHRFCCNRCSADNNRKNNPEKFKAQQKKYYWENRDKRILQRKAYEERSGICEKRVNNGYSAYCAIKTRCNNHNNKSYKYYGGSNIECLLTFEEFKQIYFRTNNCELCGVILEDKNRKIGKDSRTIDRINSNKHYEINNVRIICRSCNSVEMNKRKSKDGK